MPNNLPLIPYPQTIDYMGGEYKLARNCLIIGQGDVCNIVDLFKKQVQKLYAIQHDETLKTCSLRFILEDTLTDSEKYSLTIDETGITAIASSHTGLFHAGQTLVQLIAASRETTEGYILPTLTIEDSPACSWRGMHLDVSRHFFPVATIKKHLELMALHKMNIFHWHLCDDQGWRLEIVKHPKLTSIGANREGDNGQTYGGYYSQDEVREIVAFAKDRFITIVPEIEVPGHCKAALSAYPELSCRGVPFPVETTWGIFDDIFCAGNSDLYSFLDDILNEVVSLFPSEYIHIGGDEVPKVRWADCPKCQTLLQKERLKDFEALQGWVIAQVEKMLHRHNRKIIGWDEIVECGLTKSSAVMSWRGIEGGLTAAMSKHPVVMSPTSHCYFDYYQAKENQPKAIGGYLPLEKVYDFKPVPETLSKEYHHFILGGQANVWTEYINTEQHLDYMIYPRLCAMAEKLYNGNRSNSYVSFKDRLLKHLFLLRKYEVHYCQDDVC